MRSSRNECGVRVGKRRQGNGRPGSISDMSTDEIYESMPIHSQNRNATAQQHFKVNFLSGRKFLRSSTWQQYPEEEWPAKHTAKVRL